jgi:hypothetical protein
MREKASEIETRNDEPDLAARGPEALLFRCAALHASETRSRCDKMGSGSRDR